MDKGLLTFIFVGLIAIYLATNLIGDIQNDDESYQSASYKKEHQYEQYHGVDIVGDTILEVQHIDAKKQLEVWNSSELKQEFVELFPNFEGMKKYVNSRIVGDALQDKLFETIDSVEMEFLGGTLNGEQAKAKLENIQ